MKQILALILTALLLCGMLSPAVLAADEPSISADTETIDTVTDAGADGEELLPDNGGFGNDGQLISGSEGSSGSCTTVGSISVEITAPVLAASPSAITLTSFDEPDRTDAVAFAVGTSQENLSKWFADSVAGFTGYDSDGNPYDLISGAWSLDAVDTGTVGVYYVSAAPDLGMEYTLADGVSLPRQLCAVSIQTPGEPDINCCVSGRGFLHFPWVLSKEQQEQLGEFAVWLRQDGREWTQLSDGFCFTSEDLQLSQRIFKNGCTYGLKVTYPGGQTGVLSFQYDGELSIIDYSGGDRDGGDVSGGGSGTGSQPAPTPSPVPSDSQEDDNHNNGDNTPTQSNSSPASNEKPLNSDSTPQKKPDSSLGEAQPTPTPPQTPDSSQNSGNHNSDNALPVQAPVIDKPTFGTPAAPTELAAQVYSDTSFFHKAEGTSSELGNYAVSQPKHSNKAVLNPVSDNNDTLSKKISESLKSGAVSESYSPTQTVISGLRLRDLCSDGESVVFGSGDLTVSIPSKLLLALNLLDSDTLSVRLTQSESNKVMLTVEAAGNLITELTGTLLRFRYKPQLENAEITVQNEAGELIANAAYDGELLCFTADKAGIYTILGVSNTQEAHKGKSPLLPVSGGLILAAGAIIFFRRRRHG